MSQHLRLALMLATGLSAMANEPADPRLLPATEIRATEEGGWQLWVEGAPFTIKGAGGAEAEGLLEALREAGGNCVRTWGIETLDRVYANGETFIDPVLGNRNSGPGLRERRDLHRP
ncbi:MAG: hypothetical protein KDL31_13060, partial [Kiritimatiellae bacterium]|nr:hypothetical protein [Kiritimatiellia bacterium]